MRDSDLLEILFSFTEKELREVEKFLLSPYFNKRQDVILLFEYFQKEKKSAKSLWDKRKVFESIFVNQTYDDAKMRHVMSYLLKLLHHFVALQQWEKDELSQKLALQKHFIVKNHPKKIQQTFNAIDTLIEESLYRNKAYHFHKYQLLLQEYDAAIKYRRTGNLRLDVLHEEFTKYYLSEALRQICALLSLQNIISKHYDLSFGSELVKFVESKSYQSIPAIAVYYHSYYFLQGIAENQHFYSLKSIIITEWQLFPEDEIRGLYRLGINFCIKKQNRGEKEFIREGFELYKFGLEHQILIENGELSVFTYNNIHLLAEKLGEDDWIISFLDYYKIYLPEPQRERHYQYNLAQYYFRRKDYTKAMPLLQTLEFSDVLHNIDARKMLLVIYYDLAEFKALEALLDSFMVFIQRHKEIGYHKESFVNLIKFTKRMLLFSTSTQQERNQLKAEIQDCNHLAEKDWLLSKC